MRQKKSDSRDATHDTTRKSTDWDWTVASRRESLASLQVLPGGGRDATERDGVLRDLMIDLFGAERTATPDAGVGRESAGRRVPQCVCTWTPARRCQFGYYTGVSVTIVGPEL